MSTPRRRLVTSTTSPSLRFLGLLKQPVPDDGNSAAHQQDLELDERDVVWSSSSSAASSPSPTTSPSSATTTSSSLVRSRPISASSRHFPMGLSALLADDHHHGPTATAPVPAPARQTERERQQQQHGPHPQQQPYHQSAPVAVPAWPKAMTAAERRRWEADDDYGYGGEPVVPPHEMAARRAAAAASVMEGAGRTLKGRDLRRVRNAVWRTTGFLDL